MSFNFGFNFEESNEDQNVHINASSCTSMSTTVTTQIEEGPSDIDHPARLVACPKTMLKFAEYNPPHVILPFHSTSLGGTTPLLKIDIDQHPDKIHSASIPLDHDIVPSLYGGGYKTWECSMDLTQYILECGSVTQANGDSESVLEIGCGHALPGIAALRHLNYKFGLLSDLNEEVITDTTWANIALNMRSVDPDKVQVQCAAGHWKALSIWMGNRQFDLILSAETAYSDTNANTLVDLVKAHLTPTGTALIATKRFYFGLGGGSASLEEASKRVGLSCRLVRAFEDGVSNIRDIMELKHS